MDTPPQSQSAGTLHRRKRKPCAAPQNGSPCINPSSRSASPRAQSPLSQSASEPIGVRPAKRARKSEHYVPRHEDASPSTKRHEQLNGLESQAQITRSEGVHEPGDPQHPAAYNDRSHTPLSGQSPIRNEDLSETDCLPQSENFIPTEAEKDTTSPVDPITHWAQTQAWPGNFASLPMSSNASSKRPRSDSHSGSIVSGKSYAGAKRDGEAPDQYTRAYEAWISDRGLQMNILQGEKLVSPESRDLCNNLQSIRVPGLTSSLYVLGYHRKVLNLLQNRSEAIVQRDITPMLIPPIPLLSDDDSPIEHLCDEINVQWFDECILHGLRPQPDLAIGPTKFAFTAAELDKLRMYNISAPISNWTKVTDNLFFPFLMCEVKCGGEVLDRADRQNMNSCCIAVRAILRLVEEADKGRVEDKQLPSLSGKTLAFSVSHDQKCARVYGYYAICQGANWMYYRYSIKTFLIFDKEDDLVAAHNFVRNVINDYAPVHMKYLQEAIAALPEPPSTETAASSSEGSEEQTQSGTSEQDDGAFKKPFPPPNGKKMTPAAEMRNQVSALLQQVNSLTKQIQEKDARAIQQMQEKDERAQLQEERVRQQEERAQQQMDSLLKQLEQQREDNQRQMQQIEQIREDNQRQTEQLRQDNQRLTTQLMEHFQRQGERKGAP